MLYMYQTLCWIWISCWGLEVLGVKRLILRGGQSTSHSQKNESKEKYMEAVPCQKETMNRDKFYFK